MKMTITIIITALILTISASLLYAGENLQLYPKQANGAHQVMFQTTITAGLVLMLKRL